MAKILKCSAEHLYWYPPKEGEPEAAHYRANREKAQARAEFLTSIGVPMGNQADLGFLRELLLTEEQFMQTSIAGYVITIDQVMTVGPSGPDGMIEVMANFNLMANKLLALPAHERVFNEKCEVHISGQALSTYNEVLLLENMCSDELQTTLDNGWRIISVCPQPDQRRPDYICGRFNPEFQPEGRAKRRA